MNNEETDADKRPIVELRSDAPVPPNTLIIGKDRMSRRTKKYIYIGSGIALLVILFLGYWVFARPGTLKSDTDKEAGIFGDLPFADDAAKQPITESGLSGRTCDHPDRRAIGVMLAGDPINRPISGFSQADMVWELPVLASNVTRLLAVYQCGEPVDIGSVRSVRHDYLFLAEGIDAIVGHWGGSYHALNRIAVGEFATINALTNPFNSYFRKDHLPAPYNGFTTYERLWNALQKLEYRTTTNFAGYNFKDDLAVEQRPSGGTLTVGWPGAFRVSYEYDKATNRYVRSWAGVKQVDAADKQVVAPSVVAIMTASNGFADGPGGYNEVGIEGSGPLTVYQDGQVITGTWKKNELNKKDPVHFLDAEGKNIIFTRGQLWVMTPSADIAVTWMPS